MVLLRLSAFILVAIGVQIFCTDRGIPHSDPTPIVAPVHREAADVNYSVMRKGVRETGPATVDRNAARRCSFPDAAPFEHAVDRKLPTPSSAGPALSSTRPSATQHVFQDVRQRSAAVVVLFLEEISLAHLSSAAMSQRLSRHLAVGRA
jgi:hypothetical protein